MKNFILKMIGNSYLFFRSDRHFVFGGLCRISVSFSSEAELELTDLQFIWLSEVHPSPLPVSLIIL